MNRLGALGFIALYCGAGCQGGEPATDEPGAGVIACDPLASERVALALGEVLGAGKSADETLYVVDEHAGQPRLFVSDGDELVLENVSGSGESSTSEGRLTSFSLSEREPELHVELWQGKDGTVRMGVLEGALPNGMKQFEIGALGEELALVPAAEVAALALRQDKVDAVLEYLASIQDNRMLVVIRPDHLDSYAQFRVFFGPLDHLQERSAPQVERALDGGSTSIEFEVGDETALASFPIVFENDTFERGTPSFTLGGAKLAIELLDSDAAPAGASYYCAD